MGLNFYFIATYVKRDNNLLKINLNYNLTDIDLILDVTFVLNTLKKMTKWLDMTVMLFMLIIYHALKISLNAV